MEQFLGVVCFGQRRAVKHRACRRCFRVYGGQIYSSRQAQKGFYEFVQNSIECCEITRAFMQQGNSTFGTDTYAMCDKLEVERHDSSQR